MREISTVDGVYVYVTGRNQFRSLDFDVVRTWVKGLCAPEMSGVEGIPQLKLALGTRLRSESGYKTAS